MYIRYIIPFFTFALIWSSFVFAQYNYVDAFPNLPALSGPVDLRNANDCTNRLFVVEQPGRIKVFENHEDVSTIKVFLDITDRVLSGGEQGLLGLDFHPDFANNGYFYVNYTADNPRRTIVSRFQVSETNPDSADKNSEFEVLSFNQPYSNHNGGWVGFGPNDGYLYIATGDGGSGGDPNNYAQNITVLLGKILRIDIDNQDPGLNYAIPLTNPFIDSSSNVRKEIYSWGLRNPWRCSFDPFTGLLWAADVGQSSREEINIIENGSNYGWRCYEGNLAYNTSGCLPASNYAFPIWDYPRTEGYSVTGGYVYRGPNQPGLEGKYIYADWGSRNVWAITYDGINPATNQLLFTLPAGSSPTSFGVDEAEELYIVGGSRIRKIMPTAPIIAPSNLTAQVTDPSIVELSWYDNSSNEEGFRIERADNGISFQLVAVVDSNSTTYLDTITVIGDYQYRVNAFNSADQSGFTNTACITMMVVPVEMGLFNVEISTTQDFVTLRWETVSELNNRGFEIQRSQDYNTTRLENWDHIGFVDGKGTTTEKSVYSFVDNFNDLSFSGTLYYRLKQFDFDGTFSYSGTVSVDVELIAKDYFIKQNFPNPFNPSTSIIFYLPEESKINIQVLNPLGEVIVELVDEIKQSGIHNQNWNAGGVASGIYLIRMNAQSLVSSKNYSQTIKTVLMK
jgi:glucose/arabinose dehydrogenase